MFYFLILSVILSISALIRTIYILRKTPRPSCNDTKTSGEDLVSVLVPVRNEKGRVLKKNIKSLLSQDYRPLEVIAVDDRSNDGSMEVLKQFASNSPELLNVVSGSSLPSGWAGKVFALKQAADQANGKWLLFVDADVIYNPHTISRAINFCKRKNLDALSLLPKILMKSFLENIIMPAMAWLSLMRVSPTQANRKSSDASFGHGNFILVKKEAHRSIGGFNSYKSAVLDDCRLMEQLKHLGLNVTVADGTDYVKSRMYTSLGEIVLGFGKNSFAALNFSYSRTLAAILLVSILFFLPLISLILYSSGTMLGGFIWLFLSILAMLGNYLTMFVFGLKMEADYRFYLLFPVGYIIAIFIIAFSAWRNAVKMGVKWKDRAVNREKVSPNRDKSFLNWVFNWLN